jgi:hypothetical protein
MRKNDKATVTTGLPWPTGEGLTTAVVTVTPEMAADWLIRYRYPGQRPLRQSHIDDLAYAIAKGEWKVGAVEFCLLGQERFLTDGQHRLNAIVKAGLPAPLVIIQKRVESEAELAEEYLRTDRVLRRRPADAARMAAAAGSSSMNATESETFAWGVYALQTGFGLLGAKERSALHLRNPDVQAQAIEEWLPYAERYFAATRQPLLGFTPGLRLGVVVGICMLTCRYQADEARVFWNAVAHATDLEPGSPALVVRDIIRDKERRRPHAALAHRLAHCWDAYRENRKITTVRLYDWSKPVSLSGCRG